MAPAKKDSPPAKANVGKSKHDIAENPAKSYKTSKLPSSPKTAGNSSNSLSMVQIFVCSTRSGDMVMLPGRSNGTVPFIFPTLRFLQTNEHFARETLRIHHIFDLVDPDNPNAAKTQTVGNNERHWSVLVHMVDNDHIHFNNASKASLIKNQIKQQVCIVARFNNA